MADVESAKSVAERAACQHKHTHPFRCDDCGQPWCWICKTFHTDRTGEQCVAAIREAARREAFEEAAEWCRFRAEQLARLAQTFRIENPASRVADQSDGEAAGLVFAEEHFRALATGKGER